MTASTTPLDEVLVPIGGGVLDIYGNVIPDDLCDAVFIHSEKWKAIVIKTGCLGLQEKPVCTRQAMEVWFAANSNGREAASLRVIFVLESPMNCLSLPIVPNQTHSEPI